MRDVAEHAQVSLKTVSRVINHEPGVAVATAERVTRSVTELGFRRNDLARSLRQGSTSATLGLVIEDVVNPFYSAVVQAVERAAVERGYLLITGSCEEDPEREREVILSLMRRRVDALLLVPAGAEHDHAWLARELGDRTPVVFLDRPPRGLEADAVLLDNAGGAREAVEHLVAGGHRRVAYVGDAHEHFTASQRLAGYRAALEAAGLEPDARLTRQQAPSSTQAVVEALLELPLDVRPTAIFTGNNRHTVGALRALRGREHEIALVGFDDFELAELLVMPTTVIRHDAFRMGAEAAALAFARLDGAKTPARHVVLETRLVPRGSGEVTPIEPMSREGV
jgi:LacI family transcriptional regulator